MLRLAKNRWCAFILTLGLILGSAASFSPPSYGGQNDDVVIADPYGGGAPGDPDGPLGPNKKSPTGDRLSSGGNGFAAAPVGDGGNALRVWSWQFHVVLRSLISRFYRF